MSTSASSRTARLAPVGARSATERLAAALDGDRVAWDEIVAEYSGLLWWVARSHRLDEATSADVVQTVWLQLVQHGRSVRDPDRIAGWLATTARREALRRIGAAKKHHLTDQLDDRASVTDVRPDERIEDDETTAAALAAFHTLSPECRRLIALLCEVPPKSYEEISSLLDMPIGSIGPTRQRCLARLRAALREMGYA